MDINIKVTEQGADTIRDMVQQAQAVAHSWPSVDSELALKTTESLSAQLGRLFTHQMSDQMEIHRDGELSLYVVAGIHFGVIFFPKHRHIDPPKDDDTVPFGERAKYMGRYCLRDVAPKHGRNRYCGTPFIKGEVACSGMHEPFPMSMPVPGEWSFHS